MAEKKNRERVVAEITLAYIVQFTEEMGVPLSREDAAAFLNRNGHAYAMWKCMMQAGEDYVRAELAKDPKLVLRLEKPRKSALA
jgi:hypothetical protein